MELLLSNLGTLLVGSVVFVGICFAARSVRKEFESGGCSGCSGCSKIAAAAADFKSNKYRKNERLMVFLVGCWLSQKQIFSLKVSNW